MASTHTVATLDAVLKELYKGQAVQNLVYDESARPFLSMLKKNPFVGKKYPLPIIYEDSVGTGAVFNTAQDNIGISLPEAFDVVTVRDYSIARISTEAVMASKNDKGAFLNGLQHSIDSALNALSNRLESALFKDGSGAIGAIGSGVSGTTITLKNVEDVVNVRVGLKLVTSATKTGALTSAAARTVQSVNRDAGTFVVDVAFGGTAADNDYLFVQSDRYNNDTSSAVSSQRVKGIDAWIPAVAPTAGDNFFGVDRSVDSTRLAGVRYTGNAAAIEESLIGAAARLGRECSAVPDVALMSFQTFRRLVNELGSKVQREAAASAKGGFQVLEVYGPRGLIRCVPCTFAPNDAIFLLTLGTWEFISMGEPVQILNQDGSRVLRVSNEDALEVRCASFSQLCCNAPGRNCRITL
jgi:hypothetical protein